MSNKILFTTGLPAKLRLRINGHGLHQFTTKIPRSTHYSKVLVTSSELSKKNKIMLYADVFQPGEATISIINLTPYPVDLEEKDHIGTLVPLPSRCTCNTTE
jgi:hypothetical protein